MWTEWTGNEGWREDALCIFYAREKMLQAKQWSTGVSGGAAAIAMLHLLIEDFMAKRTVTQSTCYYPNRP